QGVARHRVGPDVAHPWEPKDSVLRVGPGRASGRKLDAKSAGDGVQNVGRSWSHGTVRRSTGPRARSSVRVSQRSAAPGGRIVEDVVRLADTSDEHILYRKTNHPECAVLG